MACSESARRWRGKHHRRCGHLRRALRLHFEHKVLRPELDDEVAAFLPVGRHDEGGVGEVEDQPLVDIVHRWALTLSSLPCLPQLFHGVFDNITEILDTAVQPSLLGFFFLSLLLLSFARLC